MKSGTNIKFKQLDKRWSDEGEVITSMSIYNDVLLLVKRCLKQDSRITVTLIISIDDCEVV